jgi:hypothetical protein
MLALVLLRWRVRAHPVEVGARRLGKFRVKRVGFSKSIHIYYGNSYLFNGRRVAVGGPIFSAKCSRVSEYLGL